MVFYPNYSHAQLGHILNKTIEFQRNRKKAALPPNPKIEWIKKTSDVLIDVLEEETINFNRANPNNKIGSNELVTSLQTTLSRILTALGMKKKDKE